MPNVAILMSRWTPQNYEILRGIYEFAHSIHNWNLQTFDESRPFAVRAALAWQANVLVSIVESDASTGLEELSQANVPLVLVGHQLPTACPVPGAKINIASVGQLLEKHLQNIKYERVLWLSQGEDLQAVANLAAIFGDRLTEQILRLPTAQLRATQPVASGALLDWLSDRGRASVILAGDEDVAIYIKRAATALGWSIPEQLAIVCLRDSLALSLPSTSITSVMQPNHELGYQAARLAHRILNGQPVPAEPVQVDTLHLTCRASSIEQGQDLAIERAVKFINENATRGITVSEVMAFQQTSRVTFERLFQASMGCTPGDYIRRIKVQKACELLTQSNQTVESIGKACGYHSPAKFSSFFKRAMGISPAAYRRKHQESEAT